MSVTSLSFTFVNMYAPQSAKPAAAAERPAPSEPVAPAPSEQQQRPGGRQNRLVEAMMTALRELGVGSQTTTTPASTSAPTQSPVKAVTTNAAAQPAESVTTNSAATTAAAVAATAETDAAVETSAAQAAAEPAVTLESAVAQFASELFRALRQVGRGESSGEGPSRIDSEGGRMRHHGHHHGHHGHHGWRNHGYGDMSQRLDALSQTFAAPTPATTATEAASNPVVSSSISITLTVQDGPADAPAQALTTASSPTTVSSINADEAASPVAATTTSPATAVTSPAKNPLLEAFSKLFNTIKPQGAGSADTDMSSKLRTFLQTLAQAMRPETMATIQTPQIGGLMNVTA